MPTSYLAQPLRQRSRSLHTEPANQELQPNAGEQPDSFQHEFFWTYTEEPHRTRRQAIIKSHPEVLKLCGPEPFTKYTVLLVVGIQLVCAYSLQQTSFFSLKFFLTSYLIGATSNQNLFLAIHEISHNLAFKQPLPNRLLAMFANLPIGIPYSASFRPYHLTHHKSLGVDGLDVDLPTSLEAMFLNSVAGKSFFVTFQILFYALRPMFVYSIPITSLHLSNIFVQIAFDLLILHFWGANSLVFFIFSSFLAGSLHPCAGHFIAEHYVLGTTTKAQNTEKTGVPPPETYSYYGILNFFTYNVGYHNEHHDFPYVPWTRLPELNRIAKEFYEELPYHKSWTNVMWRFVTEPTCGLWSRVKRAEGGRIVGGRTSDKTEKRFEQQKKNSSVVNQLVTWGGEDVGE